MNVTLEGTVGGKSLMKTWCMQPISCTCEHLLRLQRTRHRPIVREIVSLPLDKHYTGQVQVWNFDLTVERLQLSVIFEVLPKLH